jgi:hypothetical protein
VPAGQGVGGTANYPAGQGGAGYGYQAGNDVNVKAGYGNTGNVMPQQGGVYGGPGYVQQTPVSYGPDGQPVDVVARKKKNRLANWCAGAFVACWACTWPCHGPCCCGL